MRVHGHSLSRALIYNGVSNPRGDNMKPKNILLALAAVSLLTSCTNGSSSSGASTSSAGGTSQPASVDPSASTTPSSEGGTSEAGSSETPTSDSGEPTSGTSASGGDTSSGAEDEWHSIEPGAAGVMFFSLMNDMMSTPDLLPNVYTTHESVERGSGTIASREIPLTPFETTLVYDAPNEYIAILAEGVNSGRTFEMNSYSYGKNNRYYQVIESLTTGNVYARTGKKLFEKDLADNSAVNVIGNYATNMAKVLATDYRAALGMDQPGVIVDNDVEEYDCEVKGSDNLSIAATFNLSCHDDGDVSSVRGLAFTYQITITDGRITEFSTERTSLEAGVVTIVKDHVFFHWGEAEIVYPDITDYRDATPSYYQSVRSAVTMAEDYYSTETFGDELVVTISNDDEETVLEYSLLEKYFHRRSGTRDEYVFERDGVYHSVMIDTESGETRSQEIDEDTFNMLAESLINMVFTEAKRAVDSLSSYISILTIIYDTSDSDIQKGVQGDLPYTAVATLVDSTRDITFYDVDSFSLEIGVEIDIYDEAADPQESSIVYSYKESFSDGLPQYIDVAFIDPDSRDVSSVEFSYTCNPEYPDIY